ncbi:MAG: ketoacyl-ACP synthase III [Verrucomicrobia bacterium]|nr:ketoacyl-ACP synthase III [Verrucomicrobiota bacterium]
MSTPSATPSFTILGTGSHAPSQVVTNDDLATSIETSDEWIHSRTGIRARHLSGPEDTTTRLAVNAARAALLDANLAANQIDLLIVATCTPDLPMPSTASLVQNELGLSPRAACFDLNAACTGFVYALDTAWAMLSSGRYHHALVIGAEKMSTVLDWTDRTTCVLFGDGAGAIILGPAPADHPASGILAARLGTIPSTSDLLRIPGGGSSPLTPEARRYITMKGREVFKFAVRGMEEVARELLAEQGLATENIALVVPHQANLRIIHAISEYLEVPRERFFINVERYGNTSAASIPIALDEARRAGRVQRGDLVLLVAFGAGLTYGGALVRW